jgi:hypothetical protein
LMVKTLKITTFFIAAVALCFIIFISAKGIASNKDFEKFLAVPGVAEQLQTGSAVKKAPDSEQETPLIRQAKAFALRINPPPPPEPVRVKPPPSVEAPRPQAPVTAKFKLVGTSYHIGDEKNSWALIDEVGKGWHWVKQGETVGHLVIEGISDGIVLIRDGSNTYELTAERREKPNYVKSFSGSVMEKSVPSWQGKASTVTEAVPTDQNSVPSTENAQPAQPAEPIQPAQPAEPVQPAQPVPEEQPKPPTKEEIQGNINWLKQMKENPESAGMTAEEANELGNLGDMLKSFEAEIKTTESNEPNAPVGPNSVKIKDVNSSGQSPPQHGEQKSSPEVTEKQQSEPNKAAGAPEPSRRQFRRDRR